MNDDDEKTLDMNDTLVKLWLATSQLHQSFLNYPPHLFGANRMLANALREFQEAAHEPALESIYEEAIDVLTALMSVIQARGGQLLPLLAAAARVMRKHQAMNLQTHRLDRYTYMITKREDHHE